MVESLTIVVAIVVDIAVIVALVVLVVVVGPPSSIVKGRACVVDRNFFSASKEFKASQI